MSRLFCPYCFKRMKDKNYEKHVILSHRDKPFPSQADIDYLISQEPKQRELFKARRESIKQQISPIFTRAYILNDTSAKKQLFRLRNENREIDRYVRARLKELSPKKKKYIKDSFSWTKEATPNSKPFQGGAPGLGKRS